jgi:spore photoproduct lyase
MQYNQGNMSAYSSKFTTISGETSFRFLPLEQQQFLRLQAERYRFTLQDLRQITEIALDLNMWGEDTLIELWPYAGQGASDREDKKRLIAALSSRWNALRSRPNHYPLTPDSAGPQPLPLQISSNSTDKLGFGYCPVASPRTLCCNLLTLDSVDNCGFDCSYCSIQTFYDRKKVMFDERFAAKLASLELDPAKIYHIGTGQSSDSLMWGNSHNILDTLIDLAATYPNVILEMKSKSDNISHLLKTTLPPNLICTWSLATDTIISNEEHGTASLQRRLEAARQLADKGALVGFHFHPIVHYDKWKLEYGEIADRLQRMFQPKEVVMISLGTLTYTKAVIKKIRERNSQSKILKMELIESDGKLSYPDELKIEMFSHLSQSFSPSWHRETFFYLCMENRRLWEPVFGYQYDSNEQFEQAMKQSYIEKIKEIG